MSQPGRRVQTIMLTVPKGTIFVAVVLAMLGLSESVIAGEPGCQARLTRATSAPSGVVMMKLVQSGSIASLNAPSVLAIKHE
jgi:hypothetical protein